MLDLKHGWTRRIIYELKVDNVVFNVTGLSIGISARRQDGTVKSFTGTTGVVAGSETLGYVYFDPASGDIDASDQELTVTWAVTQSGRVAYFPNGAGESWKIGLA